jgi:hypothetical protein
MSSKPFDTTPAANPPRAMRRIFRPEVGDSTIEGLTGA